MTQSNKNGHSYPVITGSASIKNVWHDLYVDSLRFDHDYNEGRRGAVRINAGWFKMYIHDGKLGDAESIILPGKTTGIGSLTFYRCEQLTSVTIPDTVDVIGESSFEHCTSLKSVRLPDSITDIFKYAFNFCYSLESLSFPNTFVALDNNCFFEDDKLQKIDIRFGSSDDWFGVVTAIYVSLL